MKVDYFYCGFTRRILKHLIRVFGEFQVVESYGTDGEPIYKTVPCRYADISKQAALVLQGGSENVLNSAPMITISIGSYKIDRSSTRATAHLDTVVGVNKTTGVNQYTNELESVQHVRMMNPTACVMEINVHIWTTNLMNKLELWEQIVTLFNPSVDLQMSENPLDWTSITTLELIDSEFSSRSFPQGTDSDLDIATLTFRLPVQLNVPAVVKDAQPIHQIVRNLQLADESEITVDMVGGDILTDVYTPKNLCVGVEKIEGKRYQITLLTKSSQEMDEHGNILSWVKYLERIEPRFRTKQTTIRLLKGIEDSNPIVGNIVVFGEGNNQNRIVVEIDNSRFSTEYSIEHFVTKDSINYRDGIYASCDDDIFNIGDVLIQPNTVFEMKDNTVVNVDADVDYVYNNDDTEMYYNDPDIGWYQIVLKNYKQGLWRIGIRD